MTGTLPRQRDSAGLNNVPSRIQQSNSASPPTPDSTYRSALSATQTRQDRIFSDAHPQIPHRKPPPIALHCIAQPISSPAPDVTATMPTTRRSTRAASGPGKQSTLSFKHKVTKAIKTGKEDYKSPSRAKEYIPAPSPEPTAADDDDDDNTTLPSPTGKKRKAAPGVEEHAEDKKVEQPVVKEQKSEDEIEAAKVTDRAIERYWLGIEAGRSARAVHRKHTEGLSTGEKVLRYFDVSSQYGVRTFHPFVSL